MQNLGEILAWAGGNITVVKVAVQFYFFFALFCTKISARLSHSLLALANTNVWPYHTARTL